jgi:hypothetical protein
MLAAALVLAIAPAAANAAGFSAPRSLTPIKGSVDSPQAAVAPNGRTALLWRTTGERTRDFQYVAALGATPAQLGKGVVLPGAVRAARTVGTVTLLARPDGGFVACFADDPRRGQTTLGCSFAAPQGTFGPMHVVQRRSWTQRPSYRVALRADGTLVFVLSRRAGAKRLALRTATMDPSGRVSPSRPLASIAAESPIDLAAINDGTLAVTWTDELGSVAGAGTPTLRLMAPGASQFAPAVTFTPDHDISGAVQLQGGPGLLLTYELQDKSGLWIQRVVRRLPDGSFAPPLEFPRPAAGFLSGVAIQLPDGTPFAISATDEVAETDCSDITSGAIGAGPLVPSGVPVTATRLSAPKQIAFYPQIATLADGTVIATWGDALNFGQSFRQEVAVRPAGATAFAAPQVMPQLVSSDVALATGGNEAVLAWVVSRDFGGPSHLVVSSLRSQPPYAAQARRPTHPSNGCA